MNDFALAHLLSRDHMLRHALSAQPHAPVIEDRPRRSALGRNTLADWLHATADRVATGGRKPQLAGREQYSDC